MVKLESSGWQFTDCTRYMACTKCGALPQQNCRTPKGRKAIVPHTERLIAWSRVVGTNQYRMGKR